MDCSKVGRLIYKLRKEKGMTQKQLADLLNISDKTVSKWERGMGCPDVTLLGMLSGILGVEIEKILAGELNPNDKDNGNMKRIKFYECTSCGNVMTSSGEASLSCCGRILEPLLAQPVDNEHQVTVEFDGEEYFITLEHDMLKEHYISFASLVTADRVLLIKLYPEQYAQFTMPKLRHSSALYVYCTKHGLFKYEPLHTLAVEL